MKLTLLTVVATLVIFGKSVVGDVFFHNPRGSNDRLNGNGVTRKNANRLFNSQAYFQSGKDYKVMKGGEGRSLLTIEWTNQHGCQDRDLNCNIVIQFKCQSKRQHKTFKPSTMRNGYTTSTSLYNRRTYTTRNHKNYYMRNNANRPNRGVHEPWEWYDKCTKRNRNEVSTNSVYTTTLNWIGNLERCYETGNDVCTTCYGLFIADQKLRGSSSKYTRQNANGARYGYECPEERDYFPYWHPTDWIDIAVLTDNVSSCADYKAKSFNAQPKGECLEYYPNKAYGLKHVSKHNNKINCEKNNGKWISFSNYLEESPQYTTKAACEAASTKSLRLIWAIPYRSEDIDNLKMNSLQRCLVALDPPDCKKTTYTRSNHLGNTEKMVPYRYTWVLPYFPSREAQGCVLRIRYNISTGDYDPTKTFSDQNKNTNAGVNSPVTNNPTIQVGNVQLPLRLAINTAQFGRTFQDRSHLFKIFPRPNNVHENDVIHNLNVRGKRGNAGQAFPAVEYDFVPKRLQITTKDLIHIQWTGSNTNPANFAGQGRAGTDRHNLVEMESPSVSYPVTSEKTYNMLTNAEIVWTSDPQTKTKQDLIVSMASSGYYSGMTICQASPKKATLNTQLDNASPSYRGMLLRFKEGTYYYMCTRNNAFSNRSQKGRLYVKAAKSPVKSKRRLNQLLAIEE